MLRVKPIYGASGYHASSTSLSIQPSCTLIEYGGVKVLINVGWDETYALPRRLVGSNQVPRNLAVAHTPPTSLPPVDAVLITDSSLQALGGLPLYFGSQSVLNKTSSHSAAAATTTHTHIPVICATFPTLKMGQMTLYDHHANICLDGQDPGYTLEDVDSLFSPMSSKCIKTLKYAQTLTILDPITGQAALEITPHRAGHLVGAAYYILKRVADDTEVVVAPIFHHTKEKHLDSCTLFKFATACDVLITSPGGSGGLLGQLYHTLSSHNNKKPILHPPSVGRDEGELIETILSTLRRGGNVLLPVDASGRVLELLLLLDQHWTKHRLGHAYNLAWVGGMASNTIEFARSQVEWMATTIGAQFDSQRGHAFALKNVQIYDHVKQFLEAMGTGVTATSGTTPAGGAGTSSTGVSSSTSSGGAPLLSSSTSSTKGSDKVSNLEGKETNPTVVLASGASLDYGPARDILLKWCENSDNAVILTDSRRCVPRGSLIVQHRLQQFLHSMPSLSPSNIHRRSSSTSVATNPTGLNDALALSSPSETIVTGENGISNFTVEPRDASTSEYSTAAQLLLKWCEAKASNEEMADVVEVDIPVASRVELSGSELQSFLKEEEAAKLRQKQEDERKAMLREVELAKGRLRLNDDEAVVSDSTKGVTSSTSNMTAGKDAMTRSKKKQRVDPNLFLKYSRPCHMTFEVREEAVGIGQSDSVAKYGIGESIARAGEILEDDYGIAVRAERFYDILSGVDFSKIGTTGRVGETVRSLAFGVDGRPLPGTTDGKMGSRGDESGGADQSKVADEYDLEARDLSEGKGIIRGRFGRPPMKVSIVYRKLEVLAEVVFIPLEGRADAKAARQSVRALQPRQVVIIGGGQQPVRLDAGKDKLNKDYPGEASLLADTIRAFLRGDNAAEVMIPSAGEVAELNVGHAAYPVRLIDKPYICKDEMENSSTPPDELPSIEPYEVKVGDCTVSLLNYVATGQRVATDGSIVLAPRIVPDKACRPVVMISNGDILLTDLRSEIIAQGMKAEYSAHEGYFQLLVNGKIFIRKSKKSGKMNVEGPLCEDYFAVRSIVCNQYVTLS